MISKQTIDQIFSTLRVEEIIGEYVQLKRAGANLKGLSPFRDEKTPSFVVSPSKQIWKDFSTGKGGNAITFLMEIESFTYPEALRHAAKKYNISIEEDHREFSEEEKQAQSDKELLFKIHEIASDFFHQQLFETEEGQLIGYSYLKERQVSASIIEKFQLGYSPEQHDAFTKNALEKGYSKEILEKSGLSIFPENRPTGIDRFRDRIIFPIHSFSGRVLGFGARILKNNVKTAKYLNSPETEIYHKSQVLYGLNQGKQAISKNNLCLLVEGYMDVIALHQAGIEHVVASSGTALTVEQIRLIKRLTENVTILFDGDAAGIKASFRSIDLLLADGMNIRVLLFPDGDDPDSFSRKHSQEYVENFIHTEAKDFIDFKAEILLKEAQNDPIKKAEAIRDIVKSIAFVNNALKREIYLKEVSTKFGLSEQSLFNELNIQKQVQQNQPSQATKTEEKRTKLEVAPQSEIFDVPYLNLISQENRLVDLMLMYGNIELELRQDDMQYKNSVTEEIIGHFDEEEYAPEIEVNQKIINEIKAGLENNELRAHSFFLQLIDDEISNKLANAGIIPYELSNWKAHNIYPPNLGDNLAQQVQADILIHKNYYCIYLIKTLEKKLDDYRDTDEEKYYNTLREMMILKKLSNQIQADLNWVPVGNAGTSQT